MCAREHLTGGVRSGDLAMTPTPNGADAMDTHPTTLDGVDVRVDPSRNDREERKIGIEPTITDRDRLGLLRQPNAQSTPGCLRRLVEEEGLAMTRRPSSVESR